MNARVRALSANDREAFILAAKASADLHRPWARPPTTASAFDTYLARTVHGTASCLAILTDEGELAGVYNLSEIVRGSFQNAYLGYYAFVPHAGTGVMRAAMSSVFVHAFDELGLHRLQANVQPDNERSRRLLVATGWREEGFAERYLQIDGTWRDHVMYAITAEEVGGHRA
jgi:[ribosomal protein S5]-alanine N-acetyltransferase